MVRLGQAEHVVLGQDDEPWQKDLQSGVRTVEELQARGYITADECRRLKGVTSKFNFRVGAYYLSLIDRDNPDCPIRKQALPDIRELRTIEGEIPDPIGDDVHRKTPLLIHRYVSRALLWPTVNCPMYCRYCFRKEGLNQSTTSFVKYWAETRQYLETHTEIEEIILSGGDPLLLSDRFLDWLLGELTALKPRRRIRIHSRVPATLPSRITYGLAAILHRHSPVWLISHFNHPKEVSPTVVEKLMVLRHHGVSLANQSVLLKGINDTIDALRALNEALLRNGVFPYYLHHPDVTSGTHHFRVSLHAGRKLYQELQRLSSGLATPTYVIEIPGGGGKVSVLGDSVVHVGQGRWRLKSPLNNEWSTWVDLADVQGMLVPMESSKG